MTGLLGIFIEKFQKIKNSILSFCVKKEAYLLFYILKIFAFFLCFYNVFLIFYSIKKNQKHVVKTQKRVLHFYEIKMYENPV